MSEAAVRASSPGRAQASVKARAIARRAWAIIAVQRSGLTMSTKIRLAFAVSLIRRDW